MAITINKQIRVTGEAPFVETFSISSPLVFVTNVVQDRYTGYSDYSLDVVYPDQSFIGTTSIIMSVTSSCGNTATYSISVTSPCGSYGLGNIVKDAADPYRFSVIASNTNCTDVNFEWTYNKAIFEATIANRGLKSTLNLKLRKNVPADVFDSTFNLSVKGTDCKGCSDITDATFSFCKAGFDNITKTVPSRSTEELIFIYQQLNINGYYLSRPDGKLVLSQTISSDSTQNKVMFFGVNFNEFRANNSCFLFDSSKISFDILTTQYDIKYLGFVNISGSEFHCFIAHVNYESYAFNNKVIEVEFDVLSNEGIKSFPAKITVYPQSIQTNDIGISFTDSEFNIKNGLLNPLDYSIVNACNYTNASVLYIAPNINLSILGKSFLDTSGTTYGQNFFSSTDNRLTVVPNPNAATSNTPFLFKFTFNDTVANTAPLTIPYTLHVTSNTDNNVKSYHSGNLTLKSLCSASVGLTQSTLSVNLSCADYDDGTYDNIVNIDMSQYISGAFTPGVNPIEVVTFPTKGALSIFRNSLVVKYVAELCQNGSFTAEIKIRDINGVLSNTFTITFVVDCVGQDYYARFCPVE